MIYQLHKVMWLVVTKYTSYHGYQYWQLNKFLTYKDLIYKINYAFIISYTNNVFTGFNKSY